MLYSIMLRVSRTFFAEYGLAEYLRKTIYMRKWYHSNYATGK